MDQNQFCIRIYFHIINKNDGTGGIDPQLIPLSFDRLNQDFNPHGINFIWDNTIDLINNNNIYYDSNMMNAWTVNNHSDGIDIYVYNNSEYNYSGGAELMGGNLLALSVMGVLQTGLHAVNSSVLSHEIGHLLYLYHTHETALGQELVNGSNSSTTGDLVTDTPAEFNLQNSVNPNTCLYIGNSVDYTGVPHTPDPQNIMSYSRAHCTEYFTPLQGLRMRNALNTKSNLQSIIACCGTPNFDLVIRDCNDDRGDEPNNCSTSWESPDIWIRHLNDNSTENQNPVYGQGSNYIKVRITNIGCTQSNGNEQLKLYWTKAGTDLPLSVWEGNHSLNGYPLGGLISTINLPVISAKKDTILSIPWNNIPNPNNYSTINEPWHFCLLAKVVSTNDTSILPDNNGYSYLLLNSNNIAMKNISIISNNNINESISRIHISNFKRKHSVKLKFDLSKYSENVTNIFNEAEVSIILDSNLKNLWMLSGYQGSNFKRLGNSIIVNKNTEIIIKNIPQGLIGLIDVKVSFLTSINTSNDEFDFNLLHYDFDDGKLIGGELFKVYKKRTSTFSAAINENHNTLNADLINESATYNWYDSEGILLHTGENYTISQGDNNYVLEVISNVNGYKDYDSMQISQNQVNFIQNIYPNPANNDVNIQFNPLLNCNNAFIMIVNIHNSSSSNYILNTSDNNLNINLNNYNNGLYKIILFCNNEIIETRNLLINR